MRTYYKKAFTMLELVMVIAILGVVTSIGSTIIADVYENYILQRAMHNSSLKTELAAQQISNLLSYRIQGTTLARDPDDLSDNSLVMLNTTAADTTHSLLEWIAVDGDGFSANTPPPWNGFCDVAASSQTNIITPGSQLTKADTIISNLSNAKVALSGADNAAIFFRDSLYALNSAAPSQLSYNALAYNGEPACLGMVSSDTSCTSTVTQSNDTTLAFSGAASGTTDKVISEHYKLSWTAYAIRPVAKENGLFDLVLYYNYQPWNGNNLSDGWDEISHSTIVTDVSVFKFAESGNTFRFKICAQENIGEQHNITICKEKAIIL